MLKSILICAAVALVVVFIVFRVPPVRKAITGTAVAA